MEGLSTIAIVGDPLGPVSDYASVVISPDVGPEIITGSTPVSYTHLDVYKRQQEFLSTACTERPKNLKKTC